MPTFHEVVDSPTNVAILLICLFGAAFMVWFLAGLITDWIRVRQTFVVRFGLGEDQSVWHGKTSGGSKFFLIKRGPANASQNGRAIFRSTGLRMKRHF